MHLGLNTSFRKKSEIDREYKFVCNVKGGPAVDLARKIYLDEYARQNACNRSNIMHSRSQRNTIAETFPKPRVKGAYVVPPAPPLRVPAVAPLLTSSQRRRSSVC